MSKILATALLVLCASCHALTPEEQEQYQNLVNQGAEPIRVKNKFKAGGLNFLPGIGDYYNENMDAFWLDVFTWPLSPTWAVAQGLLTARNMNMRATLEYYTVGEGSDMGFDPEVRMELAPKRDR